MLVPVFTLPFHSHLRAMHQRCHPGGWHMDVARVAPHEELQDPHEALAQLILTNLYFKLERPDKAQQAPPRPVMVRIALKHRCAGGYARQVGRKGGRRARR